MSVNVCPQCGAPIELGAMECKFCGEKFAVQKATQEIQQSQPQVIINNKTEAEHVYVTGISPSWPIKSKIAAGLLAIFLGGLGVHKFYLGKTGMGVLYILFCWTGIPSIAGLIEGIIYLCSNDENFQLKHHVRLE